jgi:quercetin dioxygenase-like cupin family protein
MNPCGCEQPSAAPPPSAALAMGLFAAASAELVLAGGRLPAPGAGSGDVFENRVTGERTVVREGSRDNGGGYLATDVFVRPEGALVGEHLHPCHHQRVTVLSGTVGLRLAGCEQLAEAGDVVDIRAGVPHFWWNAGEEDVHALVEMWPGRHLESVIATLSGLANDGKTDANGMPNPSELAVFAREFSSEIRFTSPPAYVARRTLATA